MKRKIDYIKDFVKNIDNDFEVYEGDTFEANVAQEEVYITFSDSKENQETYLKFLKQEFGKDFNPFVISLLHEVGHIKTNDEEMLEDRDLVYGLLKMDFYNGTSSIEEYNNMYFRIPAEYSATEWAVDYYNKNKEKCEKLAKNISIDF